MRIDLISRMEISMQPFENLGTSLYVYLLSCHSNCYLTFPRLPSSIAMGQTPPSSW